MTDRSDPPPVLPPRVLEFLAEPRFASIGTVNPDGSPHQAIAWYLFDGEILTINSADGRHWPANLRRDARVSLVVFDAADPYRFVSLVGEVALDDDPEHGQRDIAAMAHRYLAADAAERQIRNQYAKQRRVSFTLRPARAYEHLD